MQVRGGMHPWVEGANAAYLLSVLDLPEAHKACLHGHLVYMDSDVDSTVEAPTAHTAPHTHGNSSCKCSHHLAAATIPGARLSSSTMHVPKSATKHLV